MAVIVKTRIQRNRGNGIISRCQQITRSLDTHIQKVLHGSDVEHLFEPAFGENHLNKALLSMSRVSPKVQTGLREMGMDRS